MHLFLGLFIYLIIVIIIFLLRPKSYLNTHTWNKKLTIGVCVGTILIIITPMFLVFLLRCNPMPLVQAKYELLADALLHGRLWVDLDIDPKLLLMDNPYDPIARNELQIKYYWDFAFFNGHYYVYFGIIPVLLLFLPFKLLTGIDLNCCIATMIFATTAVICLFYFLYKLKQYYFDKMSLSSYLMLSVAFSLISTFRSTLAPGVYNCCILAAITFELLGFVVVLNTIHEDYSSKTKITRLIFASFLFALVFGCRPPIGFATILIIPAIIKTKKWTLRNLYQIVLIILPFIFVGICLMLYNYMRFANPFEFGQTWQLTVADQTSYSTFDFNIDRILYGFYQIWFSWEITQKQILGIFLKFPIFFIAFLFLFSKYIWIKLKKTKLIKYLPFVLIALIGITIIDTLWSPVILDRYLMDLYWLCAIFTFCILGFWTTYSKTKLVNSVIAYLGLIASLSVFVLYVVVIFNTDSSVASPELLSNIASVLTLGLL